MPHRHYGGLDAAQRDGWVAVPIAGCRLGGGLFVVVFQ